MYGEKVKILSNSFSGDFSTSKVQILVQQIAAFSEKITARYIYSFGLSW